MAAMGARKIPRPDMKASSEAAEWMIFHGCMIQPAVMVASRTPRRMLMYLGNRQQMSLAHEMTLADRLVPIWATTHVKPTKKAPQRPAGPSHCAASSRGSQM